MQSVIPENNGKHIHRAIANTSCGKHKADVGMPCWVLPNYKNSDVFHYGICGKRIRSAGYVGKISGQSMRPKTPSKNTDGGRKPFNKKRSFAPTSK